MTATAPAVRLVHFSAVVRRPLVDSSGERVGRLEDLVVHLGAPHPPVVGAVVRIGGRDLFVAVRKIDGIGQRELRFTGNRVDLRRFERRPGELLLGRDLLARHLINVAGGRLIRANEIELCEVNGTWEIIGVDPSRRGVLRRLLRGHLGSGGQPSELVDWASIEPFVGHVPTARLRIPYRKLARLHPAQIADLVEAASHEEGEEIIEAVGADRELEADVFEELDPEHQIEFLESRTDQDAARLLASMAPDDAADLIMEADQDRRLRLLEALPQPQRRKVRLLLNYNPETAGGLMSPDFVSLPESATVEDALSAVRHSTAAPESLQVVFAVHEDGAVAGSASVVSLIRAKPTETLASVVRPIPAHLHADWDLGATVRKMSDFNLMVAPVLDAEHRHILGIVTVDDVLELMLPTGWRRDFGTMSPED
ncbi:MAG TPA: CBS domain-containing protein [Acidimicrobiales bacterium]|nr:CBS domain-containing protein [Acidimicrobiales bacterium]